jgi:AraC family transcriptional regulator
MHLARALESSTDDARMRRVLDYMRAHLEDPVGLNELAAVACLSPFHFGRTFRAKAAEPPGRFLSRLRLEHAKSLLAQSDRTLSDISFACQFASHANFTRAFRRFAGMTPSDFRKCASRCAK